MLYTPDHSSSPIIETVRSTLHTTRAVPHTLSFIANHRLRFLRAAFSAFRPCPARDPPPPVIALIAHASRTRARASRLVVFLVVDEAISVALGVVVLEMIRWPIRSGCGEGGTRYIWPPRYSFATTLMPGATLLLKFFVVMRRIIVAPVLVTVLAPLHATPIAIMLSEMALSTLRPTLTCARDAEEEIGSQLLARWVSHGRFWSELGTGKCWCFDLRARSAMA